MSTLARFAVVFAALGVAGTLAHADVIQFREGGGGYYVSTDFDDGYFMYSPASDTASGTGTFDGIQVSAGKASFIAVKGLFDELSPTYGGEDIAIQNATLILYRYNQGSVGNTMNIYRLTTDWLPDPAGQNETDVGGLHAEVSTATAWAEGAFSSADYDSANGVLGTMTEATYNGENTFDITPLIQQIYATGENYGIVILPGTGTMVFRASEFDQNSRPAIEIEYTYGTPPAVYLLTVNGGTGGGSHEAGAYVEVAADAAPGGQTFSQWTGDTAGLEDAYSAETTYVMPASDATITATYVVAPVSVLTVNSGSGDGSHAQGAVVNIWADSPPSGKEFNFWLGDTKSIGDNREPATTIVMPATDVTVTATYRDAGSIVDWWPPFNDFCRYTFGAQAEPLAYEIPGQDLAFIPSGQWVHESWSSACVAFETNLPASTHVEYGADTSYGSQVYVDADRYHYVHIAYLKDLAPNSTYHCRLVAEDERGNTITSADMTLHTHAGSSPIMVNAPGVLDQAGRTYILTQDVVADHGAAFLVTADNVTLDLNGHTVVYNQVDDPILDDEFNTTSATGVKAYYVDSFRCYNGKVVQGAGNNSGSADCRGFSPVYCQSLHAGEIAGVTAEWSGQSISGIRLPYCGGMAAHHNVCLDRGGDIINRMNGPSAIVGCSNIYNNLVLRARQRCLSPVSNGSVHNNEVYVDSVATNSFGVFYYGESGTNQACHMNRIFGTGYLMIGIGTVSDGVGDIDIHDNFIHLQELKPDDRWPEYGPQSGGYCCRVTWGGNNIDYHDNVMCTYGRDGAFLRGVWYVGGPDIVDVRFRNNIIKAVCQNDLSDTEAAVSVGGAGDGDDAPVVFENNRVISNFINVRFGESYSQGSNSEFYDNTFVKVGPNRPDYLTVLCGWYTGDCSGHVLYDTAMEGGASFDHVAFDGLGNRDFAVGWTLTVETEPGATVTVWDKTDQQVYQDTADENGVASTRLLEFFQDPFGRTYYTNHTVRAELGAISAETVINLDKTTTIQLPLAQPDVAGDLNGDGFVGQADLDIVLGRWGWTVSPTDAADPSHDGFVGQADLDIVLSYWGQGTRPQ
jgi:hypothetical protein